MRMVSKKDILDFLFPYREERLLDFQSRSFVLRSLKTLFWWLRMPLYVLFWALERIYYGIRYLSPNFRRRMHLLRLPSPLDELQDVVFYRPKVEKDGRLVEHWMLIERGYPQGPYIDWTEDEKRWLDRILVEQRRMYAAHRERERVRALNGEAYVQDFIFAPWALEGMSRPPDMDRVLEWMAREKARTDEADEERFE